MGRIDDDDIQRVREASDLVSIASERVVLKQKGRLFWGCCPFHNEKTASFKIDPDTQLWYCFGCHRGGDVFKYIAEIENVDFPNAVRMLADRAHIDIHEKDGTSAPRGKRERMMAACAEAEAFYHNELMRSKTDGAACARSYLHKRGFGSKPSKDWKLGYSPGHGALCAHLNSAGYTRNELIEANLAYVNQITGHLVDRFFERIMFPVHDLQGRTIAFGGRVIGAGQPKYLNTSQTPIFHKSNNLFGIDKAKNAMVNQAQAIVVEGYTDVIALHQVGLNNAVATLGTALTAQHVKLLSRFARTIVYLFDGDSAGQKAALRASEFIDWNSAIESGRNPVELKVVILPGDADPAQFVAEQGVDKLRELINDAVSLLSFSINARLDAWDLRRPEQKVRALNDALQVLYPLKNSVSATDYVNLIADRLNVEYTSVAKALREMKAPMAVRHDNDLANSEPAQRERPMSAAAEKIIEADEQSIHMERELLSLLVTDMRLMEALGADVARITWMDPDDEAMADALITLDWDASASQALFALEKVCSQAATLLASSMVELVGYKERLYQARILVDALRARDLERKVRLAKARLKDDSLLSPDQVDGLFKQTVSMQKELVELRNAHYDGMKQ